MIYVDAAIWKKSANGRKSYAHLVGTTKAELDAFAVLIGVKLHFWHAHVTMPHYDINEDQRTLALANGALAVSSREIVKFAKGMT